MHPIIEVKNISKRYNISHEKGGYISLRDVMMNVLKSPFSFLKQKAKAVTGIAKKEEFMALNDVSFTVNKGEVIGIIGHNGAGKSTLLKILSQITPPSKGEIIIRGTIGSLLEVGTGFHPELTGRENIFLNGAILGMTRVEIAKKFDQIVEFSDVGKFIDTPVKHYSSGMYVRLAFSVAAHMEPDILLVDEVLAVGDAEFQKKCISKMESITHEQGRTIIFVSHNLSAIEKICKKTILLDKGSIVKVGNTSDVITEYMNKQKSKSEIIVSEKNDLKNLIIRSVKLNNARNGLFQIPWDEPIDISINLDVLRPCNNVKINIPCSTMNDNAVFLSRNTDTDNVKCLDLDPGQQSVRIKINHNLRDGKYYLGLGITQENGPEFYNPYLGTLEVSTYGNGDYIQDNNKGIMNINSEWLISK